MNDQCHECKIRKLCYLEEPKEDWTCDHYEPCEYDEEDDPDINVGVKDTISRAKAIEAVKRLSLGETDAMRLAMRIGDYLERLSPAQLGTNLAEVGTDCSEFPNNSDAISRQAAIDGKICIQRANGVEIYDDYVVPVEYLKQLPSAQSECIKGHWIEHDDGLTACECSVCHEKYNLYEEDVFGRNFCPNCGAKMEVTT